MELRLKFNRTLHTTDTWVMKYVSGRMEGLPEETVGQITAVKASNRNKQWPYTAERTNYTQ